MDLQAVHSALVQAEPDPSLFQVPPDYTVKETGIRKLEPQQR